jgi:hypothetical protein
LPHFPIGRISQTLQSLESDGNLRMGDQVDL